MGDQMAHRKALGEAVEAECRLATLRAAMDTNRKIHILRRGPERIVSEVVQYATAVWIGPDKAAADTVCSNPPTNGCRRDRWRLRIPDLWWRRERGRGLDREMRRRFPPRPY